MEEPLQPAAAGCTSERTAANKAHESTAWLKPDTHPGTARLKTQRAAHCPTAGLSSSGQICKHECLTSANRAHCMGAEGHQEPWIWKVAPPAQCQPGREPCSAYGWGRLRSKTGAPAVLEMSYRSPPQPV